MPWSSWDSSAKTKASVFSNSANGSCKLLHFNNTNLQSTKALCKTFSWKWSSNRSRMESWNLMESSSFTPAFQKTARRTWTLWCLTLNTRWKTCQQGRSLCKFTSSSNPVESTALTFSFSRILSRTKSTSTTIEFCRSLRWLYKQKYSKYGSLLST